MYKFSRNRISTVGIQTFLISQTHTKKNSNEARNKMFYTYNLSWLAKLTHIKKNSNKARNKMFYKILATKFIFMLNYVLQRVVQVP